MCVSLCLFSALSRRVGTLQIPIIIIVIKAVFRVTQAEYIYIYSLKKSIKGKEANDTSSCTESPRNINRPQNMLLCAGESEFFFNCCFTSTETVRTVRDGRIGR